MKDVVAQFIEYLVQTKKYSAHTAEAYELDLNDFAEFLVRYSGSNDLASAAAADTVCFRAWMADRARQGLAAKSTARALSSVRGFYKYLMRHRNIKNDAIGLINAPRVPRNLSKAIEVSDVEDMRGAIRAVDGKDPWIAARDWALVLLIFGSGLRISEALALRNRDVVGRPETLCIIGKGNKERLVPMLPPVLDAIDRYIAVRPFSAAADDKLFRSVRGLPMSPRMAQKVIEKVRNYLQLPDYVTPHALRHTFATALLAGGADLRSLQELLGHSSLSTTQLYTKINMAEIMDAYEHAHPRAQDDE